MTLSHLQMAKAAEAAARSYRDTAAKIRKDRKIINSVARVLNAKAGEFKTNGCAIDQWSGSGTEPNLALSIRNIDGFKNATLVALLEELMALGMEFHNSDYPSMINRDYYGSMITENNLRLRVHIPVYVREDSDTCRRIPKSSRMVEQIEYEIVCD